MYKAPSIMFYPLCGQTCTVRMQPQLRGPFHVQGPPVHCDGLLRSWRLVQVCARAFVCVCANVHVCTTARWQRIPTFSHASASLPSLDAWHTMHTYERMHTCAHETRCMHTHTHSLSHTHIHTQLVTGAQEPSARIADPGVARTGACVYVCMHVYTCTCACAEKRVPDLGVAGSGVCVCMCVCIHTCMRV